MTVLATSKYSVLLDTSIEKISGSSLPNITAYPRDVSHQVVGDDGFFIIASMVKTSGLTHFFISYLRVQGPGISCLGSRQLISWDMGLWRSSHSQLSARISWSAASLSILMDKLGTRQHDHDHHHPSAR